MHLLSLKAQDHGSDRKTPAKLQVPVSQKHSTKNGSFGLHFVDSYLATWALTQCVGQASRVVGAVEIFVQKASTGDIHVYIYIKPVRKYFAFFCQFVRYSKGFIHW